MAHPLKTSTSYALTLFLINFTALVASFTTSPIHPCGRTFLLHSSKPKLNIHRRQTTITRTFRHLPFLRRLAPSNTFILSSKDDAEKEAQEMKKEAQKIRSEIEVFQKKKDDVIMASQLEKERVATKKDETRMRYSAEIPILKGDLSTEMERIDFPPRIKTGNSRIFAYQAGLPLGMILGEHDEIPGATRVDEVMEEGNASASGLREGDILRAVTACQTTMETPTWQLMMGGIGRPVTSRFIFSVDGRPFEEVMEAVGSNRLDAEGRPAWLVIERVD